MMNATRRETAGACAGGGNVPAFTAADGLCLAAAPTFAIMALLTGVLGGDQSDVLCAAAHDASSLSGMALMYLLMSAFHSAPWLKLFCSRWNGTCLIRRSPDRAAPTVLQKNNFAGL